MRAELVKSVNKYVKELFHSIIFVGSDDNSHIKCVE